MQRIFYILILLITVNTYAQDTIYDNTENSVGAIDTILDSWETLFVGDCNHGHNCCVVFCACCTQRNREQHYDTIYAKPYQNVQRITVVERHYYAKSNDFMPVHYRFRIGKGEWSKKYYCVIGRTQVYRGESLGIGRYPKEIEEAYQKTNSVLVMDCDRDYSILDLAGNQLSIPFQINKSLGNGVFFSGVVIQDKMVYGFSDGNGKKLGPLNIRDMTPFGEDSVAIVRSESGWSLVNTKGEFLGEKYYAYLEKLDTDRYTVTLLTKPSERETNGSFQSDEILMVSQGQEQILVNSKGERLAVLSYDRIRSFSEGFAILEKGKDTFALVNRNGKEVIQLNYPYLGDYHDGLIAVYNGDKWGFVDTTGKVVINFIYSGTHNFFEGRAMVNTRHEKNGNPISEWWVINKKGRRLKKLCYDEIEEFKKGFARVGIRGEGWTLIDHTGRELFPCEYVFGDYRIRDTWFFNGALIRSKIGDSKGTVVVNENGAIDFSLIEYRGASFALLNGDSAKPLPYYVVSQENNALSVADLKGKQLIPWSSECEIIFCSENRAIVSFRPHWNKRVIVYDLQTGKEVMNFKGRVSNELIDGIITLRQDEYSMTEYYDLNGNRLSSL